MTTAAEEPGGKFFEPRGEPESAGDTDPDAIGTNAMRALLLGLILGDAQDALYGLEAELESVGIPEGVTPLGDWESRLEYANRSDQILQNIQGEVESTFGAALPFGAARVELWRSLQEDPEDPGTALAWLRAVMATGPDAVDGVAAAAALSHWRRPKDQPAAPAFTQVARNVLRAAEAGSTSGPAREIALAARRTGIGVARQSDAEANEVSSWRVEPAPNLSMMIHGTFAWEGDWWYPGGDFHRYVREGSRPNLYSGGAPFSWSGFYLSKTRKVAAQRLATWVDDVAKGQVDTVFAHSYGGGIALMSTVHGARYETAVLLSVPVHRDYDVEWRHISRPLSVRLRFDLVLAAARARQRFGANVDELILNLHAWRHGATHDPELWASENLTARLGL